jgi:hypothetical protein
VSHLEMTAGDGTGDDAAALEDQCIWPGCTRPRAPGRASGSGRQKEYCLQAGLSEPGGGPVHNARNRWAALRGGAARRPAGGTDDDALGGRAPGTAGPPDAAQREGGQAEHAPVLDQGPVTGAKRRASELLEQARRQHAAALAGLRAELELYQRAGAELAGLGDPAALDLEIATIAARAGRQVAQAEQDAADARRAQLAAQRERDKALRRAAEAEAAAEQLTEDTQAAEQFLADRTAEFGRDRESLSRRAREAAELAAAAGVRAEEAAAAAAAAQERAQQEAAEARSRAEGLIAAARREAAQAVTEAREQAARERALLAERASAAGAEADRARADAAQARASADRARDEAGAARAERDSAQAAAAAAAAATAAADARAAASAAELERAHEELSRLRAAHAAELARLDSAHTALLDAERGRAARAETDLAALRTESA